MRIPWAVIVYLWDCLCKGSSVVGDFNGESSVTQEDLGEAGYLGES